MTALELNCGAATDTGLVRSRNEDRYWMDAEVGAFLVVDGVGGQAGGERAAEIAVAAIRETIVASTAPAPVRVRGAIARANQLIYEEAQGSPGQEGMACVLTLAMVEGGHVTIGHVGDSRLYLLNGSSIRKLTSDHSPVGEIEDAGELSEEEAMAHPRRNEVFRDVGSRPHNVTDEDFIEIRQCDLPPDAALLLCSDGLSDHLTSRGIREIAESYGGDAAATAGRLVEAANLAGGRDNITAVFLAWPGFSAKRGLTRPRQSATRVRSGLRIWSGRTAFLSYGLLLGMLLWAVLHIRG
jgi:serine/threonine protein phosphatase PrpC